MTVTILSGARTPVGALGGLLRPVPTHLLATAAMGRAGELAGITPESVRHVALGAMFGAGSGPNPAQRAATEAGLDEDTLCYTIRAGGASALIALLTSAAMLQDGEHSVIGGMDCASSQPYLLPAARAGVRLGGAKLVDGAHADAWTGEDDVPLNVTSALCAQSLGVEPKDQEALVERRRARGQPEGAAKLRVSVEVMRRKGIEQVSEDETPTPAPTPLHASLADAAAALVLGKGEGIKGAKLIGQARAGVHANRTPLAPVEAVKAVLETTGKSATDLTALLIDESLGLAAIAAERELGIPEERINPRGGALDRGYPGAACAAVALVDLVAELADKGGVGVIAYSAGTGGSLALAFEQVG